MYGDFLASIVSNLCPGKFMWNIIYIILYSYIYIYILRWL